MILSHRSLFSNFSNSSQRYNRDQAILETNTNQALLRTIKVIIMFPRVSPFYLNNRELKVQHSRNNRNQFKEFKQQQIFPTLWQVPFTTSLLMPQSQSRAPIWVSNLRMLYILKWVQIELITTPQIAGRTKSVFQYQTLNCQK